MKETREHYKVFISGDRPNCYFFKHVHRLQLLQEIGFPWNGKNPNTPTNPNSEYEFSTNNATTTNNDDKLEAHVSEDNNNSMNSDGNVMIKSTNHKKSEKSANHKNSSASTFPFSVYSHPKESQIEEYSRDKDPKNISKKHVEEEPAPINRNSKRSTDNSNSNSKIGSIKNTKMNIDVTSQSLLATILPRPSQSPAKNTNTNTKAGPSSISTPSYITTSPTGNSNNGNGHSPDNYSSSLSQMKMKMKENPVVDTPGLVANTSISTPIPTTNTSTSTTNTLSLSTMATTTPSTSTLSTANNNNENNRSNMNMDCPESEGEDEDDDDDEEEPLSTTEMIYQYVEQREKEKAEAALELVKMNSGVGVNIQINHPRHHGSGAMNMNMNASMNMNMTVKHATPPNTINTHKRKVSDSIEICGGGSGSGDDISINAARGKGVFSHTSQKPRLKNILDSGRGMQGVSGAGIGDGIGSSGGNSVYPSSFNSNSLSSAAAVATRPTRDFAGHSLSSLSSSGLCSSKAFYPHHQHHADAAMTAIVPKNSNSVTTSTTITSPTKLKSKTKPNPIRFTPHVECIEVKKHPESDQMDMLLHLILHIESTHANGNLLVPPVDGDMSNSIGSNQEGGRSSFLVDKWYSDLLMMHELCGLDE